MFFPEVICLLGGIWKTGLRFAITTTYTGAIANRWSLHGGANNGLVKRSTRNWKKRVWGYINLQKMITKKY